MKRDRRRKKIEKELFETEKTYLGHLELIHKVQMINFSSAQENGKKADVP